MSDTTTATDTPTGNPAQHFNAAVEQAKAGAAALGKQAQDQADVYRDKLTQQTGVWTDQAKERGDEAIDRLKVFAIDGKTRASGALQSVGKLVEDNATLVDDKVGVTYGDHLRTAGRSLQDFAQQLDAKNIDDITRDVQAFVRERPALSVGIAAASGFLFSRVFTSTKN